MSNSIDDQSIMSKEISNMSYNSRTEWTAFYLNKRTDAKTYPNEYLVRIFMGSYPRLNLDKTSYAHQRVLDMSCGDGRNILLFHDLGFEVYGVEITEEITEHTKRRLRTVEDIDIDIRVGTNDHIPFQDSYFDYLVSWGACYYMGKTEDFKDYVKEFARVLRPGGYMVLLVPQPTHFIYKNSVTLRPGYERIESDPQGIRNGEILRMFTDESEIASEFGSHFDNFLFGSQQDDCFGEAFHVFLVVCQKI